MHNPAIFYKPRENLILNSQAVAVSNQRSAFSLNIYYYYNKQPIKKYCTGIS